VHHLDAVQIEDLIGIAPLCAACIVQRTGIDAGRVSDALPRLIGALRVASLIARCGACMKQRVVHRLAPNAC
jgi:hypothetical protein